MERVRYFEDYEVGDQDDSARLLLPGLRASSIQAASRRGEVRLSARLAPPASDAPTVRQSCSPP